jgi:hypothetical protein
MRLSQTPHSARPRWPAVRLLPPRSAPPAAPARFTPRAFCATRATCLLVQLSGPQGPALTERQSISRVCSSSELVVHYTEKASKGAPCPAVQAMHEATLHLKHQVAPRELERQNKARMAFNAPTICCMAGVHPSTFQSDNC